MIINRSAPDFVSKEKEQGCQTNAPKARFFVSALGEVMRDGELVEELCSIDAKLLAEENGFKWEEVCLYRPEDADLDINAKKWFDLTKKAWDERYYKYLSKKEKEFVNKVLAFQDLAGFGRFRVYGEINKNEGEKIVLVTEFQEFLSKKKLWEEIYQTAKHLKAKVWEMREEAHMDITWHNYGEINAKKIEGKHHGKMERQVEFSWRVEKLSTDGLKKKIERLSKETESLWKRTGVGVW